MSAHEQSQPAIDENRLNSFLEQMLGFAVMLGSSHWGSLRRVRRYHAGMLVLAAPRPAICGPLLLSASSWCNACRARDL